MSTPTKEKRLSRELKIISAINVLTINATISACIYEVSATPTRPRTVNKPGAKNTKLTRSFSTSSLPSSTLKSENFLRSNSDSSLITTSRFNNDIRYDFDTPKNTKASTFPEYEPPEIVGLNRSKSLNSLDNLFVKQNKGLTGSVSEGSLDKVKPAKFLKSLGPKPTPPPPIYDDIDFLSIPKEEIPTASAMFLRALAEQQSEGVPETAPYLYRIWELGQNANPDYGYEND